MPTATLSRPRAPEYDADFYADDFIADPYPRYRAIRDLGAAVWLPRNNAWAIARFADVRASLRDNTRFISGRGVMMNETVNQLAAGNSVLNMDEPAHGALRVLMAQPLFPAGLAPLRDTVHAMADALVAGLVERRRFDGVADFAHHLPLLLVSRLVGLPEDGREQMLDWANGIFNVMGSQNHRFESGIAAHRSALAYMDAIAPEALAPGSWGARLFGLVQAGRLTEAQARTALFDYVAPALDTTITATSAMLWLLGTHPDQWAALRADPTLLAAAVDEALRLESPVRAFSRILAEDVAFEGTTVPEGARALIIYASANRDERHWPEPDRFLIARAGPRDHMSFGSGRHMCMGMHLARLELEALFGALVRRVTRFSVGTPRRTPHNVMRAMDSLDVSIDEAA